MDSKCDSTFGNGLPNVIYIMGTGRSGSTVLEIMLANNRGAFGAGEAFNLLMDGFIHDKECSCGYAFSECDVWSKVKANVGLSESECRRLAEKSGKLEQHKGFWRQIFGRLRKKDKVECVSLNLALLRHIKRAANAEVVIDSSKYAGRALLLTRAMPGKVRVIWLTRSPRGILASYAKRDGGEQPSMPPIWVLAYVAFVTLCAAIARKKLGDQCIHVRYEDLLADPVGQIDRIEKWSECDLSGTRERLVEDDVFEVGHVVTSNQLRKQGKITLKRQSGRGDLTSLSSRVAACVLGLWYRLLGVGSSSIRASQSQAHGNVLK